jgi:long-chain fatty acid transport protein
VRIGAVWRSAVTVATKGSGSVDAAGNGLFTDVDVTLEEDWPQQAALGVYWQASGKLGFSAQADWTDWSRMGHLLIQLSSGDDLDQAVDFHDSYALHLGLEFRASEAFALRGGYTFDSNAIPDRTIERQYLDADKHGIGLGASYQVNAAWRLDGAFEFVGGPVRHVPDNRDDYPGWDSRRNLAPGDHQGQVYSLELGVNYSY